MLYAGQLRVWYEFLCPSGISPSQHAASSRTVGAARLYDVLQSGNDLAEVILAADGYVMVGSEYNHSMSPGLALLLKHFGAPQFGLKPRAIVTYSTGQWVATRAAIGMRGFLSEPGSLPVSAMTDFPAGKRFWSPSNVMFHAPTGTTVFPAALTVDLNVPHQLRLGERHWTS